MNMNENDDYLIEPLRDALFLHFFDIQFLEMKNAARIRRIIENECDLATRFALLSAKRVFVPASSYFESPLCRKILDKYSVLFQEGIIWLVGKATNIFEFIDLKLPRYDDESEIHERYSETYIDLFPPFFTRKRSSTKDITSDWLTVIEDNDRINGIVDTPGVWVPDDLKMYGFKYLTG